MSKSKRHGPSLARWSPDRNRITRETELSKRVPLSEIIDLQMGDQYDGAMVAATDASLVDGSRFIYLTDGRLIGEE